MGASGIGHSISRGRTTREQFAARRPLAKALRSANFYLLVTMKTGSFPPSLEVSTGTIGSTISKQPPKKKPKHKRSDTYPSFGGIDLVCEITGKSRSTVLRWAAQGLIAKPFQLKGRTQNIWDIGKLIASLESDAARGG